jgi:hypothetical protein
MAVTETRCGWSVVAAGVIIKTFNSNAEAWRWIDRHEGEPSRAPRPFRVSPNTHTSLKFSENQPKCRTEPRQLAINGSAESGAASSGHSLPLAIAI